MPGYYFENGYDFWQICYKISEQSVNKLIDTIKKHGSPNAKLELIGMGEVRTQILNSIKQNLEQHIWLFSTKTVMEALHRPDGKHITIIPEDLKKGYYPQNTAGGFELLCSANASRFRTDPTVLYKKTDKYQKKDAFAP